MPFMLPEIMLCFYYWYFLKDLEHYGCFIVKMDAIVCDSDASDCCISISFSPASRLYWYLTNN
jgi:hypothetical protein